ncbi:MAG: [Fe-S]-binding protein [Cyanobacteria bacterium SIG28]|nr:[Fe-S]-binding protein [Cyanobacteria bacterium SIG28]
MTNELYPVYTLKNECHDCYKCVRECQVKAIKIQNGSASVIDEKCIACGHCVIACPSNAKRVRNDIEKVKSLMFSGKRVYVSLAPSWAGIYGLESSKMIALLKRLGFYAVSETALGAQEVSVKTNEWLKEQEKGLFISSACPVIVDYVLKYKPKFAKNITPFASPALTHAKYLKTIYGDDISIVFIGPCIGKKKEADKHPELIDFALTFDELNFWIKDEFINIEEIRVTSEDKFIPEASCEGALYPIEGGMNETIKLCGVDDNTVLVNVSGLKPFDETLDGFKVDKTDKKIFLEALSCDTGCVNGPGKSTKRSGILIKSEILSKIKFREEIPTRPSVVVEEQFEPIIPKKNEYSPDEIASAMKKFGKIKEEDELNCGGCGYATCRDLACALLDGDAESSMCVSYMRKLAMKKSATMLRCMPAAIVMVDKDLNILESNDKFMQMFCGEMYEIFKERPEGVKGASIERIVSFSNIFEKMLKTGKDIHKEHYSVNGKLYDINAFVIEENEIVGAIITDVTANEMDREKIAKKAKDVITKNIATVQEIACLLGEHMVETEKLLSSIADDYSNNSGEK